VNKNMNRKIIVSGISIIGSLSLLGAGVYAATADLTDATSTGSTFASSNPQLQIAADAGGGVPGTYGPNISAGISASHISPGHDQTVIFFLKNNGDQALALSALFNPTGTGAALGNTTGHLEKDLNIGIVCVDKTALTAVGSIGSTAFNGYELTFRQK
jgi:hypothetical protein